MIILDTTSKSLEVDMDEIISTLQLNCYTSYVDVTTSSYSPLETYTTTNSTTAVAIAAAPSASTQRQIKLIIIENVDTITHNVTIQLNVSSVTYQLFKAQLLTGEKLCYTDGEGWRVYDTNSNIKNTFVNNNLNLVSAGSTSATSGQVVLSNSNNISFGVNGQTITASYAENTLSSYINAPIIQTTANASVSQSTSAVVNFQIPYNLSVDYLRIPALMTTNSTQYAANTTGANGIAGLYSTLNAVIYTQATGTNSSIYSSILQGSAGWTLQNSISVAAVNGTQYSQSFTISGWARGSAIGVTTQTSTSLASQIFWTTFTNLHPLYSSVRFLDIPLNTGAQTLSPGNYCMVFGISTSSSTNSAFMSAATNCNVRTSAIYGNTQPNNAFAIMGSTNQTSVVLGGGSITTAGGGTLATFPISAVSSYPAQVQMAFQLLGNSII